MKIFLKLITITTLIVSASNAKVNLKRCSGCHGADFEKSALGKSKVVQNMSKSEIEKALKGYKAGTYGRADKDIMKNQLAELNDKDIETIAKTIGK
ncbi:MAG: cytochrome C [Epsilonproteobacteria bacterium]|nr:cytochrome C [Campylobacterota bacterium]